VDGLPAVALNDQSGTEGLKFIRATDSSGTTWGPVQTLVTGLNAGIAPQLEIVAGRPAVLYCDTSFGVFYMRALDADGANWPAAAVSPFGIAQLDANPVLTVEGGVPLACSMDKSDSRTYIVRGDDSDGASWAAPVATGPGLYYLARSFALINGKPALALASNIEGAFYVEALDTAGTAWGPELEIVDASNGPAIVSLAEIDGRPAMVIGDNTNQFKFAILNQ
jgi:hypothetical protein